MEEFLRIENITKKFGTVYANQDVCLTFAKGEVHTLLGENGAGKSTLMNILTGLYQPTSGQIYLEGKEVKIDSPAKAVRYGIGMVHQHFMLVEAMTVFDNIILGKTKDRSVFIRKDRLKKEISELAQRYGLQVDLDKEITEISVGEQQRVEILKALYRGAELLILDEPTAALTDIEVEGLFSIIRKLTKEGKSVIFISHKMREVMEISDKITILRAGTTVASVDKSEADEVSLAGLMIGRQLEQEQYSKVCQSQETVLSLKDVSFNSKSKHNGLSDISMLVGKGEIVGIAGVDGNGQSQLAQLVTGVIKPESGEVWLGEKRIKRFEPELFIKENVSHIPEDRNKMGLVGNMTIKENLVLKNISRQPIAAGKGMLLKKKEITKYAEEMKEKYDIRCASLNQEIRNLSGGNQQKIVLARELEQDPQLIVAVHPTRGLDIGATQYVHEQMVEARDRGCAVLLISADFDEVLNMSDRILVMYEGQIVGEYSGIEPPIEEISLAMAGRSKHNEK